MMLRDIIDWLVIVGYVLCNMVYVCVKFGGFPSMFTMFAKCPKFIAVKCVPILQIHRLAMHHQFRAPVRDTLPIVQMWSERYQL